MAAVYGSSKSNVCAVVKESAAGTPVDPSAGTDYVALQPDFTLTPNFEQLSNEEIRASIGIAKTVQGLEQPEGSFSHYLKGSGTEGTAPEFGDLLESLFGSTSANGTERTTTVGSTTSVISLGAGGSDFARGKALLIKDGTNGYSIRPVHSVSTNDLTLGFRVATAPATGINVGKCVNYAPANSGHPSLSIHSYRGNGQLYELLAGALVSELNITAEAGQFVNASYSFQGTKYHFNGIRLAAADTKLDFDDALSAGPYAATLTAKVYRDPHELAQAIQDAMNTASAGSANTYTCVYLDNTSGSAGKFKITQNAGNMSLLWNTGANTANTVGNAIGFSVAADDTGAGTYTADSAMSWAAPHTPSYDSTDPIAAKNLEVLLGDVDDYLCFCASSISIQVSNTLANIPCICAESGVDQKKPTGRQVKVNITALIDKHDADKWKRMRANEETRFAFNFGVKDGGNWVAGKCGNVYIPTCTVSQFSITDLESLIAVEMELTGYVDTSGNGEVYLNFL